MPEWVGLELELHRVIRSLNRPGSRTAKETAVPRWRRSSWRFGRIARLRLLMGAAIVCGACVLIARAQAQFVNSPPPPPPPVFNPSTQTDFADDTKNGRRCYPGLSGHTYRPHLSAGISASDALGPTPTPHRGPGVIPRRLQLLRLCPYLSVGVSVSVLQLVLLSVSVLPPYAWYRW